MITTNQGADSLRSQQLQAQAQMQDLQAAEQNQDQATNKLSKQMSDLSIDK